MTLGFPEARSMPRSTPSVLLEAAAVTRCSQPIGGHYRPRVGSARRLERYLVRQSRTVSFRGVANASSTVRLLTGMSSAIRALTQPSSLSWCSNPARCRQGTLLSSDCICASCHQSPLPCQGVRRGCQALLLTRSLGGNRLGVRGVVGVLMRFAVGDPEM